MSSPIDKLQEELRSSTNPVSAFMLIDSGDKIDLMTQKLHSLCHFGVTPSQIDAIAACLAETLENNSFCDSVELRFELQFEVESAIVKGDFCYLRNIANKGIEVEITLPGMIASNASQFIDNSSGFWCAFMPPSFYR